MVFSARPPARVPRSAMSSGLSGVGRSPSVGMATAGSSKTTAQPAGARSSVLVGVSCASTRACMAVGRYTSAAGTIRTLTESWNGTRWTIRDAYGTGLISVSCSSRTDCVAVGDLLSGHGTGGRGQSIPSRSLPRALAQASTPSRAPRQPPVWRLAVWITPSRHWRKPGTGSAGLSRTRPPAPPVGTASRVCRVSRPRTARRWVAQR